MVARGVGDVCVLLVVERIIAAHDTLQFGKLADHFRNKVRLGELGRSPHIADQLAKAAKPADPHITPFHWAIRRTYSSFYMDVDNQYGDEGTKPTIVDIGPYISETQGWTHNTVFIDMGPYLIAMEAPNDDGQAIAHLKVAREKYSNKPIKYLVLSHHHVDHVGGMRTFIG